ncbi:hypothetical protein AAVH_13848 [Aphelenchoides avenae]|nr:hypothetical protein AAVH_13848 [Aphelenchus avenae]
MSDAPGCSDAASRHDVTKSNGNDLFTNLKIHFIPQCHREWNGDTSKGTWKCVYCGVHLTVKEAKIWHNSGAEKHYNKHCKDKFVPELQSTIDKLTAEKDNIIPQLTPTIDKLTVEIREYRRANCRLQQDFECISGRDWRLCWCNEGEERRVNCRFGHAREGDNVGHPRVTRHMTLQTDPQNDEVLEHQMDSCDCLYAPLRFLLPPAQGTRITNELSKSALEKTIKQLKNEHTLLTAKKYRLLHEPTDSRLSAKLLFHHLEYAQSYLSDMKRGIQGCAAGQGLQVDYSYAKAASNALNCDQLQKKLIECLNEISRYSEIFLQVRASITTAMSLAGWSLVEKQSEEPEETTLNNSNSQEPMDSTTVPSSPSLEIASFFEKVARYAPPDPALAAPYPGNAMIAYNRPSHEILTDPSNWQFSQGTTGWDSNYYMSMRWQQRNSGPQLDVPGPSQSYLPRTQRYRIQLDADFFRALGEDFWVKKSSAQIKPLAITMGGEHAQAKNENAPWKNSAVEEDTRTTDEGKEEFENGEPTQEVAAASGLRKLSTEDTKHDFYLTSTLHTSHSSSDTRRTPIVSIPSKSADSNADIGVTGGFERETLLCDHSSRLADALSGLPEIDGSCSMAHQLSRGSGSAGPSVAAVGVGGAADRRPAVNQSPADFRRKVQEWQAETTASDLRLEDTSSGEELDDEDSHIVYDFRHHENRRLLDGPPSLAPTLLDFDPCPNELPSPALPRESLFVRLFALLLQLPRLTTEINMRTVLLSRISLIIYACIALNLLRFAFPTFFIIDYEWMKECALIALVPIIAYLLRSRLFNLQKVEITISNHFGPDREIVWLRFEPGIDDPYGREWVPLEDICDKQAYVYSPRLR